MDGGETSKYFFLKKYKARLITAKSYGFFYSKENFIILLILNKGNLWGA
jgi:hypothetical protein